MHFSKLKILTLALIVSLSACASSEGPDMPDEQKSKENNLYQISLVAADNPGLGEGHVNSVLIGLIVYLTIPESWGTKKVVPTLKVSEKASVRIDGVMVDNGDAVDLLNAKSLEVIAEDGSIRNYDLLVRSGNTLVDGKVYNFMRTYNVPAVGFAVSKNENIVYAAGRRPEYAVSYSQSVKAAYCHCCHATCRAG